jgi:hypothetical protein
LGNFDFIRQLATLVINGFCGQLSSSRFRLQIAGITQFGCQIGDSVSFSAWIIFQNSLPPTGRQQAK